MAPWVGGQRYASKTSARLMRAKERAAYPSSGNEIRHKEENMATTTSSREAVAQGRVRRHDIDWVRIFGPAARPSTAPDLQY
jgi:hypothetical protein